MKKVIIVASLVIFGFSNTYGASGDYEAYFNVLIEKGLIGKSELISSGENAMTRAKFWKIALKIAGYQDKGKTQNSKNQKNDQWYTEYLNEGQRIGIIDKNENDISPLSPIKKLEAITFVLKLFGVSTPFYQDVLMDYKDVQNDEPAVSQCLIMRICKGETDRYFGANKQIKSKEAYKLIIDTYDYVYSGKNSQLGEGQDSIDILKQMIKSIKNEYYKPEDINIQDYLYGAMEGFAESIGDKYTTFMRPTESQNFNNNIEGSYEGIGAFIEKDEEGIKIITPINGSPAQKAGLKPNDIVLEADGTILKDLKFQDGILKIKGPKGSEVKLKIKRGTEVFNVLVTRNEVEIPSIEEKIEEDILIIKINQFNKNTDEQLTNVLEKNINSIILDVRSNPGGYLDTAENILSLFVETGEPILQVQYPKSKTTINANETLFKIKNKKIAILIDGGSASASEILAGTLQDYKIAKVIGEKSYGKGTVQTIEEYFDGSQFKYTVAQWLTAKGNSIQEKGVTPDIIIKEDPSIIGDEVLEKAKKEIR